jgi:hypothetical protein
MQASFNDRTATSLQLPANLTVLPSNAFQDTPFLTSITGNQSFVFTAGALFDKTGSTLYFVSRVYAGVFSVPQTVKVIGSYAFEHCHNLTSVIIPETVTTIQEGAFECCLNLASVEFDDHSQLTEIPHFGFANCRSLENITFPRTVTRLGNWAFANCVSLRWVKWA